MLGVRLLQSGPNTPWNVKLFGEDLLSSNGNLTDTSSALEGKMVGVFFSSLWCPPAQHFVPYLSKFYEEAKEAGVPFEVVLVSCDYSKKDMLSYFNEATHPWLAVPFDSDANNVIKSRIVVKNVPTLVILDGEGNIVSMKGTSDILKPNIWEEWASNSKSLRQREKILVPHNMKIVPDSVSVARRHRVWPASGRVAFYPLRDDSKCITGRSQMLLVNTTHANSGLYLNGKYGQDLAYTVQSPTLFTSLDSFSISVDFVLENIRSDWLIVGGLLYRWFGVKVRAEHEEPVRVTLNNQDVAFSFFEGTTLSTGQWYSLSVSIDVKSQTVSASLGTTGPKEDWIHASAELPSSFEFEVPPEALEQDGHVTCCNVSNGGTFKGLIKNLVIYDRVLFPNEMQEIFGVKRTGDTKMDTSSVVPTSDTASVLRIVGTSLSYEDEKIDEIIQWFVSNDYTRLSHLSDDREWERHVTARFCGKLKALVAASK